jgi:hypothetical protein
MIYVTTAQTYTIGPAHGLRVEINQPTTGTVTIADAQGTKAIIAATTPAQGKIYYGFNGAVTVTNASAENITVSILNTTS